MKIRNTLLAIFILIQLPLTAQKAALDSIDHFIQKQLNQFGEIPGLAITIAKGDKPIFTKTYGLSDADRKIQSNSKTPYYIASVTKTFSGVLAAQLDQEGLLDLEKPITQYAPVKDFEDKALFEGVTLKKLLSHTSGIANVPLGWRLTNSGEYNEDELVSLLEHETISRNNNGRYAYDNFGYHVFRLILSQEFGLDWKDLLKKKVFSPLGMIHSSANISDSKIKGWELAEPYTSLNDGRSPMLTSITKNDQTMHAAGGMISSIEDMQKWLLVNMNSGRLNGRQVLAEEVIDVSQSKIASTRGSSARLFQDSGYGLGWNSGTFKSIPAIYHTGGFDGYYALASFLPEKDLGIAIMVNETHFGDNIGNLIVSYAYELLLGSVSSSNEYVKNEAQVTQQVNRLQAAFAADRQRRKQRPWDLTKDLSVFSGEFFNKNYGLMKVKQVNGQPEVSIGISKSKGTQSNIKDALRVEFRDGRGEDILFIFGRKKPMAIVYREKVFYRK